MKRIHVLDRSILMILLISALLGGLPAAPSSAQDAPQRGVHRTVRKGTVNFAQVAAFERLFPRIGPLVAAPNPNLGPSGNNDPQVPPIPDIQQGANLPERDVLDMGTRVSSSSTAG